MAKEPVFSVIIPTYNRPEQLTDCLRALAQQNFPSDCFEVIVVDDGGDAPLNVIMNAFEDELDVILVRQENAGPAAARNRGLQAANGRFLAFTDDDCCPYKSWLNAMNARLALQPEAIVGGPTLNGLPDFIFSQASQLIIDAVYAYYNRGTEAYFFAANNMAVSAALLRSVGGFDAIRFDRTAEDRDLCRRWRLAGYPLVFASEAQIIHYHKLSFGDFCRQHFHYGRGAYRFHKTGSGRKGTNGPGSTGFHRDFGNWLFYPFKVSCQRKVLMLCLFLLWQIINTAGFIYESIGWKGSQH